MIVSINDLNDLKKTIKDEPVISLDTETTGLNPYGKDVLFGISISTKDKNFYLNFNSLSDNNNALPLPKYVLPRESIKRLLNNYKGVILMHNAKFDMAFLVKEGVYIFNLNIMCTLVGARISYNDKLSYSLDSLGQELGYKKLDTVKEYISKNKLYNWKLTDGKKKRIRIPYFCLVPFSIISEYAIIDSTITYVLGTSLLKKLNEDELLLWENESKLQKVLYKMEKRGICINKEYTLEALEFYKGKFRECESEFEQLTGEVFCDSGKQLAEIFTKRNEKYPKTEKGNPCFKDDALKLMKSPIANILQRYREAYKKANTYFANFIGLSEHTGKIHCNFKSSGTATGRFSCTNPNLQNLNKEDKE